MYNYHVSGESRSYAYAQQFYRPFTQLQSPEQAYQMIQRGRSDGAYLVTEPVPGDPDIPDASMQSRLHDRYGSRGSGAEGLGHYRALYASRSGDYKAFRVVDGATIQGNATASEPVSLRTDVDIEGESFTYERQTRAGEDGRFNVTVPYPGEYELEGSKYRYGDGGRERHPERCQHQFGPVVESQQIRIWRLHASQIQLSRLR